MKFTTTEPHGDCLRLTNPLPLEKIHLIKGFEEGLSLSLKPSERTNFNSKSKSGCIYIMEGYLRVGYQRNSHTQTVRIAGPGELIGFGTWVYPEKYVGIALTNVQASYFDKDFFFENMLTDKQIAQSVFRSTINQIVLRDERICSLQNPRVKSRIAGTLISLANKFESRDSQNRPQIPPIVDRKILAELSGTVVETFARALTEFEKLGVIERQGKSIVITNYQGLLNISDDH